MVALPRKRRRGARLAQARLHRGELRALKALAAARSLACSEPLGAPAPGQTSTSVPGLGRRDAEGRGPWKLLECKVAFETDFQLYEQFDDLDALEDYLLVLLTAVSTRYEEQVRTVMTPIRLALYTTPADPWTTADNGGTSYDMLGEFRFGSVGRIPAEADVAHFLSGAPLGGGVAYLRVLCNAAFGFAVSSHITLLGQLPGGPVVQGPLTWDFVVVSHELGHNFGARHTFQYSPQIDDCPNVCSSEGTIMSYCHLCAGGLSNITTYFHPRIVDVLRDRAEDCLELLGTESLGVVYCDPAWPNASGPPGVLTVTGSAHVVDDDLTLRARHLPWNANVGYFLMGVGSNTFTPLGSASPMCVAPGFVRFADPPNNTAEGPTAFRRTIGTSGPLSSLIIPGSVWNFQAWYRDQNAGNRNFTNAVSVTFQ